MRPVLSLAALLVFTATLPALAVADSRPDSYALPGPAVFPEGVAFDQQTGFYYVSSTTDGTIFRGTLDEPEAEVFLAAGTDGRTSAAGLEVAEGLLYVSGGGTGQMFVYDTATGELVAQFMTTDTPTFINDVAVTRSGDAFFTNSLSPFLYRVFEGEDGLEMETFLDFTGTVFDYVSGFNANGIVATPDGRYLIVVQSNTGELFRIEIATREVVEIDLGGATVTAGDGLELRGRSLYVVRNNVGIIAEVQLSGDFSSGEIVGETTDSSFAFPTTAAIANGRLLVVNSQFNARATNTQVLPFTVSSIPVP
jgi:Cu-Zn family superoxide dismutase